ncbi:MAG: hypothetical protein ACPGRX_01660 [Bdellovibrionales bacterium]
MSFDWRQYVVLKSPLVDMTPGRWGEMRLDMRTYYQELDYQYQILADVMDQISLIPEVQKALITETSLTESRFSDLNTMYPGQYLFNGDNRLILNINSTSSIASFGLPNKLEVDPEALVQKAYVAEGGGEYDFTVQRALIHEIVGHAADKRLSISFYLQQQIISARAAVDSFLKDFPVYRNEFEADGTINGIPIKPWLDAKSTDDFVAAYGKVKDSSITGDLRHYSDDLVQASLENASTFLGADYYESELVSSYLEAAYERHYAELIERQDESPSIVKVNDIVVPFYGEEPRPPHGYATSSVVPEKKRLDPFASMAERAIVVTDRFAGSADNSFADGIGSDDLAETKQCPRRTLEDWSCEGLTVTFDRARTASHSPYNSEVGFKGALQASP